MMGINFRPVIKWKSVIICKRYLSSYFLSFAFIVDKESQEVVKPVVCVHV